MWDTVMGEQKATPTGHTGWVKSMVFSSDGRTLASDSLEGTVLL